LADQLPTEARPGRSQPSAHQTSQAGWPQLQCNGGIQEKPSIAIDRLQRAIAQDRYDQPSRWIVDAGNTTSPAQAGINHQGVPQKTENKAR
jgi:hypothetical protein